MHSRPDDGFRCLPGRVATAAQEYPAAEWVPRPTRSGRVDGDDSRGELDRRLSVEQVDWDGVQRLQLCVSAAGPHPRRLREALEGQRKAADGAHVPEQDGK